MGFPDGRIIGYDVPRINDARTGWFDGIKKCAKPRRQLVLAPEIGTLLEGCAPYLWRAEAKGRHAASADLPLRHLWGLGKERTTRNTMLPGENLHQQDSNLLSGWPGRGQLTVRISAAEASGAHEYDVCECPDGRASLHRGDVGNAPVGRQFVERRGDSYINPGTFFGIRRGLPQDEARSHGRLCAGKAL
ncbi:MAG: hypothetical protein R2881_07795 [Eubacteriales bacterium]